MNREEKLFTKILTKNRFSHTAPRRAVFLALQNHNAMTIDELCSLLTQYNRSTIYRTASLFERLGIVSRLHVGWKHKLELSDIFHHHHHHLTCSNCGKVLILKEDSIIEKRIRTIGERGGFIISDHQLEISGICKNCLSER